MGAQAAGQVYTGRIDWTLLRMNHAFSSIHYDSGDRTACRWFTPRQLDLHREVTTLSRLPHMLTRPRETSRLPHTYDFEASTMCIFIVA